MATVLTPKRKDEKTATPQFGTQFGAIQAGDQKTAAPQKPQGSGSFTNLQKLLDSTKPAFIIEDSPYDYYWGCGSDGKGKNMLGQLLCKIRK